MNNNPDQILNFIGGEHLPPRGAQFLPNEDPATSEIYCQSADSTKEDIALAVEAAEKAFPLWSRTAEADRARILRRMASLITEQLESLARSESIDSGKPVSITRSVDIPRSARNFEFFADAITQFSSETHAVSQPRALHYTLRAPLGVVGCISPWNLPLYLLTWKIAPALAAGNTVVAKPSEVTPMTAYLLSLIANAAGLPPGVLNLVHGTGAKAGSALVSHPKIKAISFTGSTRTGAEIARIAAPQFKKLSLEMGGKNASLVFADADWESALEGTLRAAFSNQGQICLCGSRILIERPIYEKFKSALVERARALKIGDPLETTTEQGALVSRAHFEKVASAGELARAEGGRVLCGGERVRVSGRCQDGWFYAPTLIEGLPPSCKTNQEEIFGPVATLTPFEGESQAVEIANGTPYGLAASVWTSDLTRAHRVAAALESGIVWINSWMLRDLRTPFGGVKQSGVGREGGLEALRFFTEPKSVTIPY